MDWLFKEDEYNPLKDKDRFIDNSIYSLLNVLSKIKRGNSRQHKGVIYRVNPMVKFITFISLIILISITRNIRFIGIAIVFILVSISLLGIKNIKNILALNTLTIIFTFIMLIPSMLMGNTNNSLIIVLKVFSNVSIVGLLSNSTRWDEITKSLRTLFIPEIFIFVMDIAIRYIYLLGEMSIDMLYALRLKSIGRNNYKYSSMSKLIGNLFLRSKEMGDEMFSAMECRGFTGEYSRDIELKLGAADAIYITVFCFVAASYFLTYIRM